MFSIAQLQQISGIKAHTIRMWEQRYNALQPNRSEGNTRYYDSNQLRRLLNIVSLKETDYKVSELCAMDDKQLFSILDEKNQSLITKSEKNEHFISQLIAAGMSFDQVYFEKTFSNCLLRFGMKDTYINIIYPMLKRVGLMWLTDTISPNYEHFIINMLKQKFFASIDALPLAKPNQDSWLLFLPENEFHEIGLLFSNYILRQAGKKVIYLGANLPFNTVIDTIKETNPSNILFFWILDKNVEHSQTFLKTIKKLFTKIKIHISGNEKLINQLTLEKNMFWIRSIDELEKRL